MHHVNIISTNILKVLQIDFVTEPSAPLGPMPLVFDCVLVVYIIKIDKLAHRQPESFSALCLVFNLVLNNTKTNWI